MRIAVTGEGPTDYGKVDYGNRDIGLMALFRCT